MRYLSLFFALIAFPVIADGSLALGGMNFSYEFTDETVLIELNAPTNGWIGVGFNERNDIVNSDLLLFNIVEGEVTAKDFYVVSFGNPREDVFLGGSNDIRLVDSEETADFSQVRFELPIQSSDSLDFPLEQGEPVWIILAFSVDDDFAHHSRMRLHEEIVLQ